MLLLAAGCARTPRRASPPPAPASAPALAAETRLFRITTTADEALLRRLVAVAGEFARSSPLPGHEAGGKDPFPDKVHLHVDASRDAYERALRTRYRVRGVGSATLGPVALPPAYYGQYIDPHDPARLRREIRTYLGTRSRDEVLDSVRHELGHLRTCEWLQNWNPESIAAWVHEGLAELYALSREDHAPRRLRRFVHEAVRSGAHIPFGEFRALRNVHTHRLAATDAARSRIVYAQAWSVMEFLSREDPLRYRRFLERLRATRGLHAERAFRKAYGIRFEDMEPRWRGYVLKSYPGMVEEKHELARRAAETAGERP